MIPTPRDLERRLEAVTAKLGLSNDTEGAIAVYITKDATDTLMTDIAEQVRRRFPERELIFPVYGDAAKVETNNDIAWSRHLEALGEGHYDPGSKLWQFWSLLYPDDENLAAEAKALPETLSKEVLL